MVIAPTEPIREYLVDIGVSTRTETVPTGIDFSRFNNVTDEQVDELRTCYGLERFDKILLSVGRISKEKNLRVCLLALGELVERGGNYALLMLGDGPDVGDLEGEAEKLGIGERLIMGGFLDQDKLAAAYFLGDVFLFPSKADTQGIVLYEAQAAGLPVVATDTMASRAAVRDGENGLFAEDNPKGFADKIDEIMSGADRFREPFDTNAFSHDALGGKYDRLYNETLAKGRTRPPRDTLTKLIDEIKSLMMS